MNDDLRHDFGIFKEPAVLLTVSLGCGTVPRAVVRATLATLSVGLIPPLFDLAIVQ